MKHFVAIGSSIKHDYSFFLPIVCLLWRKMGYEPVLYLVDNNKTWKEHIGPVVIESLTRIDANFQYVDSVEGVEDATVAQSIRLYAAADSFFHPEDLLIPSDADLLPLRKEFYYTHDVDKFPIGSYYSNGYGDDQEGKHYPSCHISAKVKTWREFMGLEGDNPHKCMIGAFERRGLAKRIEAQKADHKKWEAVWFEDEYSISEQIQKSQYAKGGVQMIRRDGQPPKDRLDRAHQSKWSEAYDINNYTDAHSIRPGWSDGNWPRFRPLVEQALPEHLDWLEAYRAKFREVMGCPG